MAAVPAACVAEGNHRRVRRQAPPPIVAEDAGRFAVKGDVVRGEFIREVKERHGLALKLKSRQNRVALRDAFGLRRSTGPVPQKEEARIGVGLRVLVGAIHNGLPHTVLEPVGFVQVLWLHSGAVIDREDVGRGHIVADDARIDGRRGRLNSLEEYAEEGKIGVHRLDRRGDLFVKRQKSVVPRDDELL